MSSSPIVPLTILECSNVSRYRDKLEKTVIKASSDRGVRLMQRLIPFPLSISNEARSALESLVGDDGVALNAKHEMPQSDDHEGWIALKNVVARHYESASIIEPRAHTETLKIGTATIHIATPVAPFRDDCVYVDLHGGALVFGGGEACRTGGRRQADRHGMRCYAIDYRMPPEHPYPAALDDCIAAYRHLLESYPAEKIVIGGRSAGGNLAIAMLLRAKKEKIPMPAGLVLLSPQVDLTESGDSFETNRMIDVVLPGSLLRSNLLYAGGEDLAHPYLSPLFGDLEGLPPTFLQSGTRDIFLSNTVRMHRRLRQARVPAELHVFEAMPHGGFTGNTPEDRELVMEIERFVQDCLPMSSA